MEVIILNKVLLRLSMILFFTTVCTIFESTYWAFALVAQFKEWLLVLGLLVILLSLVDVKKFKSYLTVGFASSLILAFSLAPHWSFLTSKRELKKTSDTLQIFYGNIQAQNKDRKHLINFLKNETPDIALLVEFNSQWAEDIKGLKSLYPFTQAIIREDNFGMAVLSRHKISLKSTLVDRENLIPALFLNLKYEEKDFTLVLLHSFPPIGGYATLIRDRYLQTIARRIGDEKGSVLVCGDFNTSPWTSIYSEFVEESGLTPEHPEIIHTWPTRPFAGLPIDHCLSKNLIISQKKKGPYIGSDHWPLTFNVSLDNRSIAGKPSNNSK